VFQDFVFINKTSKQLFRFLFLGPLRGSGAGAPWLICQCPQEMSRTLDKTLGTATVRKLASKQPPGLEALLVTISDFNCILARSYSSFILELNRTWDLRSVIELCHSITLLSWRRICNIGKQYPARLEYYSTTVSNLVQLQSPTAFWSGIPYPVEQSSAAVRQKKIPLYYI